ncbi:MAG: FG-GAP-like repeat-containing protein [Pseudomonadota bacterium]
MPMKIRAGRICVLLLALSGCGESDTPVAAIPAVDLDDALASTVDPAALRLETAGLPAVDDPLVQLGRSLFFSRTLSGTGDVACASCHHPYLAGGDGLSLPVGVQSDNLLLLGPGRRLYPNAGLDPVAGDGPNVPRNSPTTFNSVFYNRAMFHDGRLFVLDPEVRRNGEGQALRSPDSLQNLPDPAAVPNLTAAQSRFPITSLFEMRGYGEFLSENNATVRTRIEHRLQASSNWLDAFRQAFDQPAAGTSELLTFANIDLALGEYQRSQVFVANPWQAWLQGDRGRLSEAAKRGALLFFRSREDGGAGCAACHSGPHLSNEGFYVSGFPQIGRGKNTAQQDFGRREVTQSDPDRYRFRVPGLLNVAKTAPYGHAGTFDTLAALVRYHIDPPAGAAAFDYTLQGLRQYQGLTVRYPRAAVNSRLAAEAFMASDSRDLLYQPGLGEEAIGQLVAFLEAQTDPCLEDTACLDPWVATAARDNPDGAMLVACFRDDVVPGHSCPAGSGGGVGSGSNGGDTVGPEPVARDPASVRDPALLAAQVAARQACANGLASASNDGGNRFLPVDPEVSGLTQAHGYTLSTWLNNNRRQEDFLVSGGLAVGDVDGDCWSDLLLVAGDYGNHLYRGNGASFSHHLSIPGRALGGGIADLDGDFRPELLLGEFVRPGYPTGFFIARNEWPQLTPQELGQSGVQANRSIGSLSVGDYNQDGWPDLFMGMWTAVFNTVPDDHLWRGLGDLRFQGADPGGLTNVMDFTFTPAFADLNNDGRTDLLMAGDFENSHVYLQTEARSFQKITDREQISDENGMGGAVADFDNDGDLDWFVSAVYSTQAATGNWGLSGNRFYRNPGNGYFRDDTEAAGVRDGGWGWGSCAADFDNDGDLDIYQVEGYGMIDAIWQAFNPDGLYSAPWLGFLGKPSRLFINDGSGHFSEQALEWGADDRGEGRGLSCLDADRDGDLDLLIANNSGRPSFYLNQAGAGAGRRFLSVRLLGLAPNTEALGARIYVSAAGRTQMREVSNGSNYLGNNPLEQHFGLGAAATVDIRVVWPRTGQETRLQDVPVNQFLVIGEP